MYMLLDKPKSKQRIEIVTDANDDWFLHVNYVDKKTSKIAHSSMIIRKDLESHIRYFKTVGGGGWIEQKK